MANRCKVTMKVDPDSVLNEANQEFDPIAEGANWREFETQFLMMAVNAKCKKLKGSWEYHSWGLNAKVLAWKEIVARCQYSSLKYYH